MSEVLEQSSLPTSCLSAMTLKRTDNGLFWTHVTGVRGGGSRLMFEGRPVSTDTPKAQWEEVRPVILLLTSLGPSILEELLPRRGSSPPSLA